MQNDVLFAKPEMKKTLQLPTKSQSERCKNTDFCIRKSTSRAERKKKAWQTRQAANTKSKTPTSDIFDLTSHVLHLRPSLFFLSQQPRRFLLREVLNLGQERRELRIGVRRP